MHFKPHFASRKNRLVINCHVEHYGKTRIYDLWLELCNFAYKGRCIWAVEMYTSLWQQKYEFNLPILSYLRVHTLVNLTFLAREHFNHILCRISILQLIQCHSVWFKSFTDILISLCDLKWYFIVIRTVNNFNLFNFDDFMGNFIDF